MNHLLRYIGGELAKGRSPEDLAQEILDPDSLVGRAFPENSTRQNIAAQLVAQQVVRERLGCPYTPMFPWLLERKINDKDDGWDLGVINRAVVQAPSGAEARNIMARKAADEGPKTWLRETKSSCIKLPDSGPARVIVDLYTD